jgi:hypothetical protein
MRTTVRPGDVYHVDRAPGMYWFVERVTGRTIYTRCLRSRNSTWRYGQQSDLVEASRQNVIVRDLPDFEAASAYMALVVTRS